MTSLKFQTDNRKANAEEVKEEKRKLEQIRWWWKIKWKDEWMDRWWRRREEYSYEQFITISHHSLSLIIITTIILIINVHDYHSSSSSPSSLHHHCHHHQSSASSSWSSSSYLFNSRRQGRTLTEMEKQSKALEIKQQYVLMMFSVVCWRVELHYDLYHTVIHHMMMMMMMMKYHMPLPVADVSHDKTIHRR